MVTLIKDIFTSQDGESYCFAKVLGAFILVAFVFVSVYWYGVQHNPIDPPTWGGVLTGIYTAVNTCIRATHITEPKE